MDFIVKYIINNKDDYTEIIDTSGIEDYYIADGTVYYNFGKVDVQSFESVFADFFECDKLNVEEYKFYRNGFVELNFEPMEFIITDSKELIEYQKEKSEYSVTFKYNRKLGEIENDFFVNYIFSNNLKLKDVIIYNSTIK